MHDVSLNFRRKAKYETGESVPDIDKSKMIADFFGVSLDDLANYNSAENKGMKIPPKGKHMFGSVNHGKRRKRNLMFLCGMPADS